MTMAEKLKMLRSKSGYTQEEIAKKIGVGSSTVCMWELGQRQPNVKKLKKMALLYGVTVDYILEE